MLIRFKIMIVICILLGIVTTYAVAWSALWYTNLNYINSQSTEWYMGNSNWVVIVIKHYCRETVALTTINSSATDTVLRDSRIPDWCTIENLPDTTVSNTAMAITENALGWPNLCLRGKVISTTAINDGTTKKIEYYSYLPVLNVPYKLIWFGFLLNLLFYTLIWICIIKIPGSIRYRRRLKHNLCLICKYDLRASPELVCPECGSDQNKLFPQAIIIRKYMYGILAILFGLIIAITIHHINR